MTTDTTPIRIGRTEKEELRKIGSMGETYNTVIKKLITFYKNYFEEDNNGKT